MRLRHGLLQEWVNLFWMILLILIWSFCLDCSRPPPFAVSVNFVPALWFQSARNMQRSVSPRTCRFFWHLAGQASSWVRLGFPDSCLILFVSGYPVSVLSWWTNYFVRLCRAENGLLLRLCSQSGRLKVPSLGTTVVLIRFTLKCSGRQRW